MRVSLLQKYILRVCYTSGSKPITRGGFVKFYDGTVKPADAVNIITKSLESLIGRELMVGFGVRTSHKWFIKAVQLTLVGRKIARKLMGEQQRLPLKIKILKSKS